MTRKLLFVGCESRLVAGAMVLLCTTLAKADDLPKMPVTPENVRMLCVGVNSYEDDCVARLENGGAVVIFHNLEYAEADALAMQRMAQEVYGFDTRARIGSDATRDAINADLDWLAGAGKDGAAIFYFSGHGCTAQQANILTTSRRGAYLIPAKSKLKDALPTLSTVESDSAEKKGFRVPTRADALSSKALEGHALPIQEIVQKLQSSNLLHAVVIVDACCSGYQLDGVIARGGHADETRYSLFQKKSRAILTAGTDTQAARESSLSILNERYSSNRFLSDAPGHGWFTAEIIKQLSESNEPAITNDELHASVHMAVHDVSGGVLSDNEMQPQRRATGNGCFIWVKKPNDKWLERVQHDATTHDMPRVGNRKGSEEDRSRSSNSDLSSATNGDDGPAIPSGSGPVVPSGTTRVAEDSGPAVPGSQKDQLARTQVAQTLAEQLENAESRLDLLCVALKAAEMHSGNGKQSQPLETTLRWSRLRDRCILSASSGDADAMGALYYAYSSGIAVRRDAQVAKSWSANGADVGDPVAKLVYEQAFQAVSQQHGSVVNAIVAKENQEDAAGATAAMGGALMAIHGLSNGSTSETLVGVFMGTLGFANLMQEPGVTDAIDNGVRAHKTFCEQVAALPGDRDLDKLKGAADGMLLAAQRLDAIDPTHDKVNSPFRYYAKPVAQQLRIELNAYMNFSERRGRSDADVLAEIDRRFEELIALYTSRCAAIKQTKPN